MLKILALVAALLPPQDHAADPVKALAEAAKRLAELESYSWTLKVENQDSQVAARQGLRQELPSLAPLSGSRTRSGFTVLKLAGPGGPTSAVLKLNKAVFETSTGWKLAQALSREKEPRAFFFSTVLALYPMPPDQLPGLLEGISELRKVREGEYAGKLSPAAARALLEWTLRGGGMADIPEIKDASGQIGIQTAKGILAKYSVQAKGSVTVVDVPTILRRTLQVAMMEVNAVNVDAPAEAKKKLE